MERRKPLMRKTPLQAKTDLRSKTPLQSGKGLETRTPLKNRSPLKKRSAKQQAREDELLRIKLERIRAMISERGFAWCEKGCGRGYETMETARTMLHAHHDQQRSLGGKETEENLMLWCARCHTTHHAGGRVFWADGEGE